MPPKAPLIASPRLRDAALGAGMLALLAGSLALAWGVTGVPVLPPPPPPSPERVDLDGVSITLPWAWQLETERGDAARGAKQWIFANTASSAERLRVFQFVVHPEAEPRHVLNFLVRSQLLVTRLVVKQGATPPRDIVDVQTRHGEAIETLFPIARSANVPTPTQLHAVRLFTTDRKRYWLLQLTDQISRESHTAQAEAGHREQLRKIADTLAPLLPADAQRDDAPLQ